MGFFGLIELEKIGSVLGLELVFMGICYKFFFWIIFVWYLLLVVVLNLGVWVGFVGRENVR